MKEPQEPLVSIITPVYNSEEYLSDCVDSVLLQSYSNWELLLIDDCSTDNSINIIEMYANKDKRIKLYRNEFNKGPALTRNLGLDNAKGEYIAFLDSDDYWGKEKLFHQIEFMLKNNASLSHGNYFFTDLNKNILKKVLVDKKLDYSKLLKGNQIKTMSLVIKSSVISDVRFKNIKHEDYIFLLEIMKKDLCSYADSSTIDSFCRIGKVSVSSNKIKSALWTWNVFYKYEKLGFFKAIYYFIHYAINGIIKYK
ncbi:glycosyl transferase family A [Pasteurellaceae bacterium Macca]|nr:glycosyl transferase family A [Pasteurellaceae bacterium Macca]